jgi:hypothetical protein
MCLDTKWLSQKSICSTCCSLVAPSPCPCVVVHDNTDALMWTGCNAHGEMLLICSPKLSLELVGKERITRCTRRKRVPPTLSGDRNLNKDTLGPMSSRREGTDAPPFEVLQTAERRAEGGCHPIDIPREAAYVQTIGCRRSVRRIFAQGFLGGLAFPSLHYQTRHPTS